MCRVLFIVLTRKNFKSYDDDADSREREQAEGEERGDDEDWFDVVFHVWLVLWLAWLKESLCL